MQKLDFDISRGNKPANTRSVFFELFLLTKEKERFEAEKITWLSRINEIDAKLKVLDRKLAVLQAEVQRMVNK